MWEPPRKDHSKKRLRQITLAQAFRSYNKKLKAELGSESSVSGQNSATVSTVLSENDDDEKTESDGSFCEIVTDKTESDSSVCEIVKEISLPQCQVSAELELESVVEIAPKESPHVVESDGQSTLEVSASSLDLFPEISSPTCSSSTSTDDSEELLSFVTSLTCRPRLGVLESSDTHTVLVRCPLAPLVTPQPYPEEYFDCWDSDHVRLPCSVSNLYPVRTDSGEKRIESRWEMIRNSFSSPITCTTELEEAILQYNSQYARRWNFRGLRDFFPSVLDDDESQMFFRGLLPRIVRLALSLPEVCTRPIPLLKRHRDHSITLSQKQIACLLANAFLCTFPRRNASGRGSEYDRYPSINFNQLFSYSQDASRKHQKLLCFFNYFRRVTSKEPTGLVTFHRQSVRHSPHWAESVARLKRFHVQSEGTIEEEGSGMLQVDFANRFVGGGVLNSGLVQEEIRFVICPELVVSRLFTECLDTSEVLIVTGCEQFNKYSGYSDSFVWEGDFKDQTPRDEWGRTVTEIVAMDALHFTCKEVQYKMDFMRRELRKVYAGFYSCESDSPLPAVATGNWGCGVFGGDAKLKALIQYLAASEVGRDIAYFTFGEEELAKDLKGMVKFLREKDVTVGQLWKVLSSYYNDCVSGKPEPVQLYDYVRATLA